MPRDYRIRATLLIFRIKCYFYYMDLGNQKDVAASTWFGKWPAWLRWATFPILAITGSLLGSMAFMLIVSLSTNTTSGTLDGGWYRLLQSAIFGGLFVYIGAFVAPRYQVVVAVIMLVIAAILITSLSTIVLVSKTESTWYQILHALAFLAGSGSAVYAIYDQMN